MPRKLLLVTGSRAFDGHSSAPRIQERIRWLVHALGADGVVLNGGAVGPDQWSSEKAKAYGVKYVELYPSGQRHENGRHVGNWSKTPRHPLDRNRELVEYAVKAKASGWDVTVHGFVAPWSSTNGTRHTLKLARERGLAADEYVYPVPKPCIDGMAIPLRAPCDCGSTEGVIHVRGGQNVVYCAACDRYGGFNAPKAETGERGDAARIFAEDASETAITVDAEPLVTETLLEPASRPDIVWIDLETGGTSPKQHPILEIAAVHSDPSSLGVLRVFETKIAVPQGFSVDARAAEVNGYNPIQWRGAPSVTEALTAFRAWLPEAFTAAGYNFSFDRRFLEHWFTRHEIQMPGWRGQDIDPMPTVRATLKKQGFMDNARLDSACHYYGIYNDVRHRALADAERARLVYLALLGKTATNSIFDQEMVG
jgi:DNA polymerase III epsilon subunit-like protein